QLSPRAAGSVPAFILRQYAEARRCWRSTTPASGCRVRRASAPARSVVACQSTALLDCEPLAGRTPCCCCFSAPNGSFDDEWECAEAVKRCALLVLLAPST